MNNEYLHVTVVYAHSDGKLFEYDCAVESGATIVDALRISRILLEYPDWNLELLKVGIFGHRQSLETILYEGDRVEIYRPLKIDPKDRRRVKVNNARDTRKWRQLNKNNAK